MKGVDARIDPATRGSSRKMLTMKNAFYLATVGGAQSLHVPAGVIQVGHYADLQIVRQNWQAFQAETPAMRFEKFMYHTTKANIDQVMVQGKLINLNQGVNDD